MSELLKHLKKRRLALKLKQDDMKMRIGMSRQQYQNLEKNGNPTLDTLELIASGLKGEILFVPNEKLEEVRRILSGKSSNDSKLTKTEETPLSLNPWIDILKDDES